MIHRRPSDGAVSTREVTTSPGRWSGLDNGWMIGLADEVLIEFSKSIIKYPSIERVPGKNPKNPVPLMDPNNPPKIGGHGANCGYLYGRWGGRSRPIFCGHRHHPGMLAFLSQSRE
jgi:hypothetical protein